jgi:hypothetical protein
VLHIAYQCIRRSALHRQLLSDPGVSRYLRDYTEESDRLWDLLVGVLRDCWSAWATANRRERQLDPNNFFKAEGRTQKLTAKLIPKYERRATPAVRDLLVAVQ